MTRRASSFIHRRLVQCRVVGLLVPFLVWSTCGCATLTGYSIGGHIDRGRSFQLTRPNAEDLAPLRGCQVDLSLHDGRCLSGTVGETLEEPGVVFIEHSAQSGRTGVVRDTVLVSGIRQIDVHPRSVRTSLAYLGFAVDLVAVSYLFVLAGGVLQMR